MKLDSVDQRLNSIWQMYVCNFVMNLYNFYDKELINRLSIA